MQIGAKAGHKEVNLAKFGKGNRLKSLITASFNPSENPRVPSSILGLATNDFKGLATWLTFFISL